MKDFKENNCRLCRKVFCCQKCRMNHEENTHKMTPDCNICFYGRTYLNDIKSPQIFKHIEREHLPVHCINCKKLFQSVNDLLLHSKCVPQIIVANTPVTPAPDVNYESSPMITPIYENVIDAHQHLGSVINTVKVTSTPMLRDEKDVKKLMMESTRTQSFSILQKSSIKQSSSSTLNDSKKNARRVTFSDTPIVESFRKQPKNTLAILQGFNNNDNNPAATTSSDLSNSSTADSMNIYYSLTDNWPNQQIEVKENNDNEMLDYSNASENDSTLWETATNHTYCSPDYPVNLDGHSISHNSSPVLVQEARSPKDGNQLWTSMTSLVRSVFQGLTATPSDDLNRKRGHPDDDTIDEDLPLLKRRKFVDIRCRRPIRGMNPLLFRKRTYSDKATQTMPMEFCNIARHNSTIH